MGTNKAHAQGGAAFEKKELENLKGEQKSSHRHLRKTKLCMFHLQGACQFGRDCAFAHFVAEMNSTPDLRKTQLCKVFANGKCEDADCTYAHGHEELCSTAMFTKKTLCIWNEKSKCRNGSHCRFAHGLKELHCGIAKEAGLAAESETQSKAGGHRKGKQNQKPRNSISSSYGSGSDNTHISSSKSPGRGSSSNVFSRRCTSSTDFSQQCSSSDFFSGQCSSASEPMKVQPRSVSGQQPSKAVPDQMQSQWQDSLSSRIAALESNYVSLKAASWQQHLNSTRSTGSNPGFQADLDNLCKGLGVLTAQCSQMQERMESPPVELPPWMPCMLQNDMLVTSYPDPTSTLLWHMQVQD